MFVTVTSHEALSVERAFEVWPDAWKKLRQRMVRQYGKPEYFMVSEKHKTGKLHMHALVSRGVEKAWLKTSARECGLGYMADVKPVDQSIGAAFYVSKYLAKFGEVWPTGWRRVRLSNGWPRDVVEDEDEHTTTARVLSTAPTVDIIEAQKAGYESIGYTVEVSKSCYNGIVQDMHKS